MSQIADTEFALDLPRLDASLPMPLYHQLFEFMRETITSGAIPTGGKLPSESYFVEKLGVSRITVKRAMDELANSGLVRRKRGRGTIVITNTDLNFSTGMDDYVKNVLKLRENTRAQILSRKPVRPTQKVRENLKLGPKERVERIEHVLFSNDQPISLVTTYVPVGLTDPFGQEDLEREPLLTLFLRHGVKIVRTEQRIFATAATDEQAHHLSMQEGKPLLTIRATMYDSDNRPVEDIYAYYHPDRYQYQMTLQTLDTAQN